MSNRCTIILISVCRVKYLTHTYARTHARTHACIHMHTPVVGAVVGAFVGAGLHWQVGQPFLSFLLPYGQNIPQTGGHVLAVLVVAMAITNYNKILRSKHKQKYT